MSEQLLAEFIIGESAAMQHVRMLIMKLAPTTLPILIQGPTGSGKELVAQAIHRLSGRDGVLVAVNVCAISETMFEDALFGHVRGAFSGAIADRLGFLAEAHRGSIFLDEIGGLPLAAQVKLLRAIETGEYRPVGARSNRRSEFRVIAAANEDLRALAAAGRFRSDLLHRLGGVVITVPGIEQRVEDIPLLAQHFASRVSAGDTPSRLSAAAIRKLQDRPWPGNVRELKHLIEHAAAWAATPVIGSDDIAAVDTLTGHVSTTIDADAVERRRLLAILEEHDWYVERAAKAVGVHRATFSSWLRRLGIQRPASRQRRSVLRERGMALLEVIVALTILAIAGLSAVAGATQAMRTARQAHNHDAEVRAASAYMDVLALWTRADLDRHLGDRREGRWMVRVDRPARTLYDVAISDSTDRRLILLTTLYRPEAPDASQP
jgi:prepilin-type N-terminal cleavage/methylation domain-containing protein